MSASDSIDKNNQQNTQSLTGFHSPVERLKHWQHHTPEAIFLRQPDGKQWQEYSFQTVWHQASCIAHALSDLPPRSHIAIYSLNCAHWFIADLAILMAGHISVPIYPTAGEKTISYILNHADIELAFVGKLFDWQARSHCFSNIKLISMFDRKMAEPKTAIPYIDDLIAQHSPLEHVYEANAEELATIVYTSGTTGDPKGVRLSYRAISSALNSVEKVFEIRQSDRFFSYLPLAHVAERMAVEMCAVYFGAQVSFVQSLDHFASNLQSVKPTIFFAVPRIWLKLKQKVEARLGGRYIANCLFRMPYIGNFLKQTVLKKLGLSETRLALSAAASLPRSTLNWFDKIGIEICEAYGLSETCGFSHINLPGKRRAGTVGQPFPDALCTIASNGEVLLSNPSLMDGYHKQEELSAQAVQDDWFRTGDLGEIDEDDYLTITGRVKDIFKTSKGKYVSPVPLEKQLTGELEADHLCVLGANLPYPVVVAVVLSAWSDSFKKSYTKHVKQCLEALNKTLEKHEQIKGMLIVNEDWTVENELITPTLKLRRQKVEQRYEQELASIFDTKNTVVWRDISHLNVT